MGFKYTPVGFEYPPVGFFSPFISEALVDGFADERARFHELMADKAQIDEALAKGAEKARAVAAEVLARVRERAGY